MGALAFTIPPRYPNSAPTTYFATRPPSVVADARGLRARGLETSEKQNYDPRRNGAQQLPLQHGEKPIRKVLRADPGALPTTCMVAGSIFSGFIVQSRDDEARGVARFSATERGKVVVLGCGSRRRHGFLRGVLTGSRAKAGSSQRIPA